MKGSGPSLRLQENEFTELARQMEKPGIIPLYATIPLPASGPYDLFRSLGDEPVFLLETMEGTPRRAVRSIIGLGPRVLCTIGETVTCDGPQELQDLLSGLSGTDPVACIRSVSDSFAIPKQESPGFFGGLVGYCTYDMVTPLNAGMVMSSDTPEKPVARFIISMQGIVYDHVRECCQVYDAPLVKPGEDAGSIYRAAADRIDRTCEHITKILPATRTVQREKAEHAPIITRSRTKEEYEAAVRRTLEEIRAGEIFQAVISRRFTSPYEEDPRDLYGIIREMNPSPYLYYLDFQDEIIIGSSPEMLVKVENSTITTVPIAGTRPRGSDPEEDDRLAADLLDDEKERAEHLMLVDLARNDIGRVSAFGSVAVSGFMEIERFSHVQHITSLVQGRLRPDKDRFDALSSCFPAGTVSGAPKIRAMQIISEQEPDARGLYAGAVGYIGFDDRLEFAIAIRTIRLHDGLAEFQTGAGIVADSDPEKEYLETEFKAGAMMRALAQAGGRV